MKLSGKEKKFFFVFFLFLGFLASVGSPHENFSSPFVKSLFKSTISKSDKLANWTQQSLIFALKNTKKSAYKDCSVVKEGWSPMCPMCPAAY